MTPLIYQPNIILDFLNKVIPGYLSSFTSYYIITIGLFLIGYVFTVLLVKKLLFPRMTLSSFFDKVNLLTAFLLTFFAVFVLTIAKTSYYPKELAKQAKLIELLQNNNYTIEVQSTTSDLKDLTAEIKSKPVVIGTEVILGKEVKLWDRKPTSIKLNYNEIKIIEPYLNLETKEQIYSFIHY